MTIEEKTLYLDKANKYWHQNANIIGLYSKENELDVKNAYIDGLAEGKPKWHDLRKDPNDLPKEDCEIITLHENGNKNIQKWKNGNWANAIVIPVIAWCEIPTFTDKE